MRAVLLRTALTLLLLGSTAALASASWPQFETAFPAFPCQDGWASCLVEGEVLAAGTVSDAKGRPHAADMRVGFWDFEALPAFSPYEPLSVYTGERQVLRPKEPAQPAEPPAMATNTPKSTGSAPKSTGRGTSSGGGGITKASNPSTTSTGGTTRPDREPAASTAGSTSSGGSKSTGSGVEVTSTKSGGNTRPIYGGSLRPKDDAVADAADAVEDVAVDVDPRMAPNGASTSPPVHEPAVVRADPVRPDPEPVRPDPEPVRPDPEPVRPDPEPASQDGLTGIEPTAAAASAALAGCDDLIALEAPAMMGDLNAGQRSCLEGKIGSTGVQTTKDKISRLLLQDAEARRDSGEWERLMKRHLEQIDRSDPNLCLKYAMHLSRGGTRDAHGVIRWSNYALENKHQWTGGTHKKYVYALYRLRANAAAKLWQSAEKQFVSDRSDQAEADAIKRRGVAKDYARQWLDYARNSGQEVKSPLALCVSAAGNKDFCE